MRCVALRQAASAHKHRIGARGAHSARRVLCIIHIPPRNEALSHCGHALQVAREAMRGHHCTLCCTFRWKNKGKGSSMAGLVDRQSANSRLTYYSTPIRQTELHSKTRLNLATSATRCRVLSALWLRRRTLFTQRCSLFPCIPFCTAVRYMSSTSTGDVGLCS